MRGGKSPCSNVPTEATLVLLFPYCNFNFWGCMQHWKCFCQDSEAMALGPRWLSWRGSFSSSTTQHTLASLVEYKYTYKVMIKQGPGGTQGILNQGRNILLDSYVPCQTDQKLKKTEMGTTHSSVDYECKIIPFATTKKFLFLNLHGEG